jgi:hypothetical protein
LSIVSALLKEEKLSLKNSVPFLAFFILVSTLLLIVLSMITYIIRPEYCKKTGRVYQHKDTKYPINAVSGMQTFVPLQQYPNRTRERLGHKIDPLFLNRQICSIAK